MLSLFFPLSVKILFLLRVLMRLNRIQNEIQITSSLKSFYLHPSGFTLCMFTTSFCDKKSLSPFILLGERQAVMYKLSLTSFQDILFSCRNLRNFFKVCFLKTMFFLEKNPPHIFSTEYTAIFKHRASMLVCVDKWEIFKIGKCSGRYVLKKEYYESRNV